MSSTREALGFWGKREEAKKLLQKMFFAPPTRLEPDIETGGLTSSRFIDYDFIVDALEQLVVEGSEEMRNRYGGREEGM